MIALVVFGEELCTFLHTSVTSCLFGTDVTFTTPFSVKYREWGRPVRYTGVHAHHKSENDSGTIHAVYKEDLAVSPGVKCKAGNPLENISYSINMRMDIVQYLS